MSDIRMLEDHELDAVVGGADGDGNGTGTGNGGHGLVRAVRAVVNEVEGALGAIGHALGLT